MMLLFWIHEHLTLQKLKEDAPSVIGAVYMTVMTYFDFDIFSNDARSYLIPFCMALGWILSTMLVVVKIWKLVEEIKEKRIKTKSALITLENARSSKALAEFYEEVHNIKKSDSLEEIQKKLEVITEKTNINHNKMVDAMKNG